MAAQAPVSSVQSPSAPKGAEGVQSSTQPKGSLGRQAIEASEAEPDEEQQGSSGRAQGPQTADGDNVLAGAEEGFQVSEDVFDLPKEEGDQDDLFGEEQEASSEQDKEQKPESRAQKRIRTLISKTKELSDHLGQAGQRLQQYDNWARQVQTHSSQMQQRMHQLEVQNARLAAMIESGGVGKKQSDDPVERFRDELRTEILGKAKDELSPQMKAAMGEVKQLKQQIANERIAAERAKQRAQYNSQTDSAVERIIVPHLDGETAQAVKAKIGNLVLLESLLRKTDFDSAAKNVRDLIFQTARGVVRAKSKQSGQKLAEAQKLPAPTPKGRGNAKGEEVPDMNSVSDFRKWVRSSMRGGTS